MHPYIGLKATSRDVTGIVVHVGTASQELCEGVVEHFPVAVLLLADGLTLRHGAFVAIGKQATKEGRGITRVGVKWAWDRGIVAKDWKLSAPFAVNPAGAKESEKKDTAPPCNP